MNDTILPSENPSKLTKNLHKRVVVKKIKTIDKNIEKNKAQYNLDRQAAKVSAFLSGNFGKYESLTGTQILPKGLLQKAATIKNLNIHH